MDDEVIVKPKPIKDFARKKVIYIPVDSPSRIIQKALEKNAIKESITPYGRFYLLEDKVVLLQCLGAPLAILSLEIFIVSGAREILLLGFCGSLSHELKIADILSISKAFSEEGTSKHYFSRRKIFCPSSILRERIESTLNTLSLPFSTGTVVSTDAPYRETKSWLAQKQKRGIYSVDMEISAVFALAEFYEIHAAALMVVSDELSSGEWKTGFHHPKLDEKIKKYFFPFINK